MTGVQIEAQRSLEEKSNEEGMSAVRWVGQLHRLEENGCGEGGQR